MKLIAAGRASEVFDLDDGRVLRRFRAGGNPEREGRVMKHARRHGYPVPRGGFGRLFLHWFLPRFDRDDLRRALPAAAELRVADVNVTDRERGAVRRLLERADVG